MARLARGEREATALLIASLAEFDARRLYLGQGCSSMYTYCTRVPSQPARGSAGVMNFVQISRSLSSLLFICRDLS